MGRRLARLTDAERAELARLHPRLATGEPAVTERFARLMWKTDFANPCLARILDEQPLYQFPRNEDVFRAVTRSYKDVLDAGLEEAVRQLDAPVLVIHGSHDTHPAGARRVAELARRGQWVELEHSAHCPWLEEPSRMRERLRALLSELL